MNSLLFLMATLLLSSQLFAESVQLKNGTVLKGVIVEMNQTDLIIDTAEMGRVTVKRYTIQKISDDSNAGSAGSGTVINVNNSNNVEQKNEQSNSQVNNQTANAGKGSDEARRWHQGLQGRFNYSQETVRFDKEEDALKLPKHYEGVNWDLLGFRSESWWAVYLELSSLNHQRDSTEYTIGGGMIRLDWNAVKSVNGDTLSLLYFGLGVGSGSYETEITDSVGEKTSIKFSGSRQTLRVGYDYFWGKYWGLSAFGALNQATYGKVTYQVNGQDVAGSTMDKVLVSSSSWGIGLLYNFDL